MKFKRHIMDTQMILIVILIGVFAGMMGGLIGIGGGVIIVPALVYFIGLNQHMAQGTSLGLLMLPVGILAFLQYYKSGYVDLRIVGLLGIGFLVGSYFGSRLSISLPQQTIKRIFAIMMILIAVKMLFFDKPKEPVKKNITLNRIN